MGRTNSGMFASLASSAAVQRTPTGPGRRVNRQIRERDPVVAVTVRALDRRERLRGTGFEGSCSRVLEQRLDRAAVAAVVAAHVLDVAEKTILTLRQSGHRTGDHAPCDLGPDGDEHERGSRPAPSPVERPQKDRRTGCPSPFISMMTLSTHDASWSATPPRRTAGASTASTITSRTRPASQVPKVKVGSSRWPTAVHGLASSYSGRSPTKVPRVRLSQTIASSCAVLSSAVSSSVGISRASGRRGVSARAVSLRA